MYHSKHPHTQDESLPYVQHSYNRETHSSTSHSPFKVFLRYQPLAPINVSIPIMQPDLVPCLDKEKDKAMKFIDRIHHLQQQVHDSLEQTTKKYKQRHDQHRTPHYFQVGDKVWLHLQGPHRKLCPLFYGPYKIIKKVGENAFELSLPPF